MAPHSLHRRKFLQQSALTAAGFFIVPRHVLGRGFVAPSDKLNIAAIGVGGKGESDIASFAKSPFVNIVALCDVDDRQAAEGRKKYAAATYYRDFRVMLEKEKNNIDACSISTPDHTHAVATLAAMQLGKHVYTQKPLTHDIYEARLLAAAAKKYKVVTQMGNQGGSGEGVRRAQEMYEAGLIGEVTEAHAWTNRPVWPQGQATPSGDFSIPTELDFDLWLGPAKKIPYHPAYLPFNWRGWWAFGTGALGDMACHILDPVYRLLPISYPESAECSVATVWKEMWNDTQNTEACPPASIIHLRHPRTDGKGTIKVSWYDGGLLPPRPEELGPEEPFGNWDGGVLLIGTKGKMLIDCYGANPRLLPTRLMKETALPAPYLPRVTEGHYLQWVNACKAGYENGKTSSPFSYAGPFTESILMGNLAIRSWLMKNPNLKGWDDKYLGRKKLIWDAKAMKVTNFDEANEFVRGTSRPGWELPTL
ncbi:MAG: Gfo/Idh/MocA family oxidoreductase [Bacteroidetes bacterium]|nr:Gfo/Idh/MocA family oxidoreductase [Bacteroidota bacterium]